MRGNVFQRVTHLAFMIRFHQLNHLEYDVENENERMEKRRNEDEEPVPFNGVIDFIRN